MKKLFLLGVLCALCAPWTLSAQKDYLAISKSIANKPLQHPYLLLNEQTKKEIKERVANDPEYARIMDLITQQGRRIMLNTVEMERPVNDIASRYNETPLYEQYIGTYRHNAHILAFLYQMTGEEAYAQKAFDCIDKLCALENWAAGAHHFEIIYPRVWPYGAKDDQVVFTYDIMTADCALIIGLVYDWIYPALGKAQRDRIRSGLLENAITRVRGNYEYHWWSEAYKCNWSAICHSGLGTAALALLTEDPHLVDVVARSYEGFEKMISNYGNDNAWAEGRSYATYGIREAIIFADVMKTLTNGQLNLFQMPGWKHPADFALFGLTGTFNDGSAGAPTGYSHMYNKFVTETKDPTAMWYLDTYLSGNNRSMDMMELIWPRPTNVEAIKPEVASKYFPSIQWAFMRKDFGEEYLQVAAKCAPADDPHHGHLDAGTFNITWKGDIIVGEVEQKFYDQFFFNELRWEYLYVRSQGHNVVLVNGEEQIIQKHKDGPWLDPNIGGKIEKFVTTPEFDYTLMDASKAYPNVELKSWKRALILDKETNMVLVLDRVGSARGAKIELLFHPRTEVSVNSDKTVSFVGQNTQMEMQHLSKAPYNVVADRQFTVRVVKNNPLHWVPCLFTTLQAPTEKTVIGTVFYPSELKDNALGTSQFTLDESGVHPVIRGTVNGKSIAYEITEHQVTRL